MVTRPIQSYKKSGDIHSSTSFVLVVYHYYNSSQLYSYDNAYDANRRKYWVSIHFIDTFFSTSKLDLFDYEFQFAIYTTGRQNISFLRF